MGRLYQVFKSLPLPQKAIALGVVLVLAFLLIGGTQQITSWVKDRGFASERDGYKAKIAEKTEAGEAAEARARAAEGKVEKQELVIELAGKEAVRAQEKVTNAETKFNEETERIGVDVDNCTRLADIRAKLRLPPVPCQQAASPGGQ